MRGSVVFVVLLLFHSVNCDSTFRFGAVISTEGNTRRIRAKQGFELYFETVSALNGGRGFYVEGKPETKGFHFKYDFLWKEDFSDKEIHEEEVKKLLTEDKIHFLGGSLPLYADVEMRLASRSNVLCYHCCVAPDTFYKQDFRTSFGISASNTDFTKLLLRRLSFENVNRMMIIYENDDEFTKTTCEAAIDFENSLSHTQSPDKFVSHIAYNGSKANEEYRRNLAQQVKNAGIEALIACVSPDSGKILTSALHDLRYPLKVFYMTVGPARQWWIDVFDPPEIANDLLSSAQWHKHVRYKDPVFNTTEQYVMMYKEMFEDHDPDDDAAAASAVGVTLTMAIQNAFASCDISETNGDVDKLLYNATFVKCDDGKDTIGYDRVLKALATLDTETFFGKVKFDAFRRNIGLDPVTTQVFERISSKKVYREIEPVLPYGYATELLNFPAENRYRDVCKPGYFQGSDAFEPCQPCQPGEFSEYNNSDHCYSCPIGEWNNETAQENCKKCPEGTRTIGIGSSKLTDCICLKDYFTNIGLTGVECEPCPDGAECQGDIHPPIPLVGYWANESIRGEVHECDGGSVCLGGINSTCKEGHTGRLCADCDDGYFNIIEECYECFKAEVIIILCISLLIGWYVINVIVSQSVDSLEMILSWAQLANIIGDIDLNWTKMLRTTFAIANILDFDVDILEPSCLLPWCYMNNFVVQLCLPCVMTSMALSGYVLSVIVYKMIRLKWIKLDDSLRDVVSLFIEVPESNDDLRKKWDSTIATLLASVDITYVTIAKYCFDCFKCKKIGGVSVLDVEPNIECGTRDHKTLVILASLGIVFYVIGYLAFVSWKLYDLHQRRAFSSEVNLNRFGFLYRKYELDYYYTPAIAIVRKVLFVLVLVFMNNPAFQIGTIAIVINASLMIHVYTAPYVETYLDVLFSFLLLTLMFEAFGGLMFYSENLPVDNRSILEWIVMSTLFLLLCVFLIIFSLETTRLYHMHYLKRKHKQYAREEHGYSSTGLLDTVRRLRNRSRVFKRSVSIHSVSSSKDDRDISFELLDTFHPHFVYKSLKKRPDFIHDWDKLTNMLKNYMSDQSETSYLSMEPSAKFWRKLVDRFPELIDFLAVADTKTKESFNHFATNLYRNFYLSKKVSPLPLMGVLNWRDYAPMAQWLAIAPEQDRHFFLDFMSEMFRTVGDTNAAEMLVTKLENGGNDPHLMEIDPKKVSRRKQYILDNLSQGSNPFMHSASSETLSSAASVTLGVGRVWRGLNRNVSLASVEERSATRYGEVFDKSVTERPAMNQLELIDLAADKTDEKDKTDSQTVLDRERSSNAMQLNNQTSFKSEESNGKSVSFSPEISAETNSSDEEE